MNIFFDTEFTGLTQDTSLISIGLVADTGETFYAELTDYNTAMINDWIQKNVINNLLYQKIPGYRVINNSMRQYRIKCSINGLAAPLTRWLSQFGKEKKHILWADVPAYDTVLFSQIFGGSLNLPANIHYAVMDIGTLIYMKGHDIDIDRESMLCDSCKSEISKIMENEGNKHNSLYDALVCKAIYKKMTENKTDSCDNPSWDFVRPEPLPEMKFEADNDAC